MKIKFSSALLSLFAVTMLPGCAGFLNVGESEFSCPASSVEGLKCMGVRDLYKATDGPLNSFGKGSGAAKKEQEAAASGKVKLQQPAVTGYDPTPWMDKPTPIRSQAKVMRIWVAPFEDDLGDLNAPGLVFTEIEPRRWNVGEGLVKRPARLTPVQVTTGGGGQEPMAGTNPFGVTTGSGQQIKGLKNIPVPNQNNQRGGAGVPGGARGNMQPQGGNYNFNEMN